MPSLPEHPSSDIEAQAANEARFRDANESILSAGSPIETDEPLPFLCECDRNPCNGVVRLTRDEYEHVRSSARTFLYLPEHEDPNPISSRVVERHERYLVVEKLGDAADVAERTNPRDG